MRRSNRPARVVSVCLLGKKATAPGMNRARADLLMTVVQALAQKKWAPIDAVIFPGGYFRSRAFIGHRDHEERCQLLLKEAFAEGVCKASRLLDRQTSGAILAVGCDSAPPNTKEIGDQSCIAFRRGQIIGLARKIFPASGDTAREVLPIVPCVSDYGAEVRFVTLPNGSTAMLAACYDLFGLTEDPNAPGRRAQHVRYLWDGRYIGTTGRITALRNACLAEWHRVLKAAQPDLAVCAIHRFKRPGLDGFWQRHGIASASAVLNGGLVVGAAHFESWLPKAGASTLASDRVPKRHLTAGTSRQAYRLAPSESFGVAQAGGELAALVRLFEARPATIQRDTKRRS